MLSSTRPIPLRSPTPLLLKPAAKRPHITLAGDQHAGISHPDRRRVLAKPFPAEPAALQQAVDLPVGSHDGDHRSASPLIVPTEEPDGDARQPIAQPL